MSNYKDITLADEPDLSAEELKTLNEKNRKVLLAHEHLMPTTAAEQEAFFNNMPLTADFRPKDGEANEDWEAMNALLADIDPLERAHEFKNTGNRAFKLGKSSGKASRFQDAYGYYSNGLEMKCGDAELESVLLCNRALASMKLENFGRAISDCQASASKQPDNLKAYVRGAESALAVQRWDTCLAMCDEADTRIARMLGEVKAHSKAKLPFDYKLKTLSALAAALHKSRRQCVEEREEAREKEEKRAREQKQREAEGKALDVQLAARKGLDARMRPAKFDMSIYPGAGKILVNAQDQSLRFPVLFLVPELEQSDFVEKMHESNRFVDQLEQMFPPKAQSPPWDPQGNFNTKKMKLFYEAGDAASPAGRKKVWVSIRSTLRMLLERPDFLVEGMPMINLTMHKPK
jgi:tetratricopeptide (TPR) repeat protein